MVKQGYKQTEIGVIPEDWNILSLKDISIGKFTYGVNAPAVEYMPPLPNYIRITDISDNGRFLCENRASVVCEHPEQFTLKENDIVFARTGASTGKTYLYRPEDGELVYAGFLIKASINPSLANSRYVFESLHTRRYWNWVATASMRSGQPGINGNEYSTYLVATPELTEQTLIAEALEDVDKLIISLEKQIYKKKAIKQGAMQELLTGKRRLPGFSGEWGTKKLGDYCSLITKQTGFDYSAYIKPALITRKMPNTLPMIQTINFRGRKFAFETDYYIPKPVAMQFSNIVLNEKCVLFSIVGASVGNVGLYPGGITAFCGGAIGITRFHDEQDAEWVYNYMSSPDGQSQIQYVTKGGAQATVTIADIRNFKIPTPEKDERDAISSILENMDHEIEVLEEKLAKYRQVKQGMMQQLLTGKIRLV